MIEPPLLTHSSLGEVLQLFVSVIEQALGAVLLKEDGKAVAHLLYQQDIVGTEDVVL